LAVHHAVLDRRTKCRPHRAARIRLGPSGLEFPGPDRRGAPTV